MKSLVIKCPHCHDVSELFLGSETHMVVLNCPSCNSPLMYYYGKTFEIDQEEFEKIQGNFHMTTVPGILRNQEAGDTVRMAPAAKTAERPKHKVGAPVMERSLQDDDIVNLRIDLALTKDVNDFISML